MSKINVVIAMDGDGHFQAALRNNRDGVIEVLKCVDDGEYYTDIMSYKKLEEKNPWSYSVIEWGKFLSNFIQRGTVEIPEI